MKKLFVLRHAKSSWANPDLADFDRPLNERGLRAARYMGGLMNREGLIPELIVSSPAERARQTTELAREGGQLKAEIRYEDRIYEASPQTLQQIAAVVDNGYASIMIVGHNPGIEGFIRLLTGVYEPMPTAALAVIDLDVDDWSGLSAGCGKLIKVIRPKDGMKSLGKAG